MLFASTLGRFFQVMIALGALAWLAGTTWFGYEMTGLQYSGTKNAEKYSQMAPMVLGIFLLVAIVVAWKILAPALTPSGKKPGGVGAEFPIADEDIDAIIARHTKGRTPGTSTPTIAPKGERRSTPDRRASPRNSPGFGRRNV